MLALNVAGHMEMFFSIFGDVTCILPYYHNMVMFPDSFSNCFVLLDGESGLESLNDFATETKSESITTQWCVLSTDLIRNCPIRNAKHLFARAFKTLSLLSFR